MNWINAHPAVVLAVLTCLVNAMFKPRSTSQYAALPVRLAAFLKITSALGVDPVKLIEGLRELVTGHPQSTMVSIPEAPDTHPEILNK